MAAESRTCSRCGRIIEPRGGAAPRFCAVCGAEVSQEPSPAPDQPDSAPLPPSRTAIASLAVGLLSLVVVGKLPLGILAVVLGIAARRRIRDSDGQLGGSGLALAGIILGVIDIFGLLLTRGGSACLLMGM
ncbi:MAG: DUF4190 domain-containing protein [Planctomycetes bacterium]|nr:DUF4190 domain-containing protein [Planctomycetota bacterium]